MNLDIDENHFVCACSVYADIREVMLPGLGHTEFNDRYDNLFVFWMTKTLDESGSIFLESLDGK